MAAFPTRLIEGYQTFKEVTLAREGGRYRRLADKGQSPETLIIACCDSRAAPETIFSTDPGDIFVIRNVANLVPPYEPDGHYHATSAALEFAVQSLKVKHILVLGHGRCGGIKAAFGSRPRGAPVARGFHWQVDGSAQASSRLDLNEPMDDGKRKANRARADIDPPFDRLSSHLPVRFHTRGEGPVEPAWCLVRYLEWRAVDHERRHRGLRPRALEQSPAQRGLALAAQASISTSMSGRARPSTISSVEVGRSASPITFFRAAR